MRTIDADLLLAKNLLYSEQPWVWLFAIEIDDTDTLYLAAYPEDIRWNGRLWQAFPAYVDTISEEVNRRGSVNVHVANVNREISAYVENNTLLGRDVTIYLIYRERLDITEDVLSWTYRVNRIERSDITAVFELGQEDLLALQLPHQRYIRGRCRFRYKGALCNYPNDDFGPISEQDLAVGGDGDHGGGWSVKNFDNMNSSWCKIEDGNLYLGAWSGGPWRWNNYDDDGPFVWKRFVGDFDINVRYTAAPEQNAGGYLLMTDDADAPTNWVAMGSALLGSTNSIVVYRTTSSTTTRMHNSILQSYWRMARSGTTITFYAHDDYTSTWTAIYTLTNAPVSHAFRVGFMTQTWTTDSGGVQSWDYFHMTSGGLSTCDLTRDGPNGCRVHQHQPNYGGFDTIPRGRLYGI
jgi:hypothetical protein